MVRRQEALEGSFLGIDGGEREEDRGGGGEASKKRKRKRRILCILVPIANLYFLSDVAPASISNTFPMFQPIGFPLGYL